MDVNLVRGLVRAWIVHAELDQLPGLLRGFLDVEPSIDREEEALVRASHRDDLDVCAVPATAHAGAVVANLNRGELPEIGVGPDVENFQRAALEIVLAVVELDVGS